MPKRWERTLSDLPRLTEPERIWRDAADRAARPGATPHAPRSKQRLIAGAVAVGVFVLAALFVWEAFRGTGPPPRPPTAEDPTTIPPEPGGSFASITFARPAPGAESPVPSATLVFGDFSADLKATGTSFVDPFATTAELPLSALGLPAGLQVRMGGDAAAATVEIYASSPFEQDPVAAYDLGEGPAVLPSVPGTYFLSVRGEWSDGSATYLWGVPVVPPGTLQMALEDHGHRGEGTAELWVDGRRVEGAAVERSQEHSDLAIVRPYPPIAFATDAYVPIEVGARIQVRGEAAELSAGLTGPRWKDARETGIVVKLFGPQARVPGEPGRHLLVVDAVWQQGVVGWATSGYREEVRFVFPVEVVGSSSTPSVTPLPFGPIVVKFDTSEEGKIPSAFALFGGRKFPAVMTRYRFTIDGEVFESSKQHRDAAMVGGATIPVPAGVRIEFEGDQDRVLAGWGEESLAPVPPLAAVGSPGQTLTLRFRGEWDPDSFVEWELFLEIVGP